MNKWIDINQRKPKAGQPVLLLIIYQNYSGGFHSENERVITGGIGEDGEWWAGNQYIIWDLAANLGFTEDDISHWMPLPSFPG